MIYFELRIRSTESYPTEPAPIILCALELYVSICGTTKSCAIDLPQNFSFESISSTSLKYLQSVSTSHIRLSRFCNPSPISPSKNFLYSSISSPILPFLSTSCSVLTAHTSNDSFAFFSFFSTSSKLLFAAFASFFAAFAFSLYPCSTV